MPRFPSIAPLAHTLSAGVFGPAKTGTPSSPKAFPLHVGDTYLEPLPAARAEAQRSEGHPELHRYAPNQGEPALLQAILDKVARRSGVQLDQECVQVMAGATAAMNVLCTTLLAPGDEVIIPAPFWPLIRGAVQARGATAVEVPIMTRLDDEGFDPVQEIERALTPRTCAIYVNTPHNPTGHAMPESLLQGIAALATTHNLWIIADEAYEDVWFGPQPPASVFARADMAGRVITTHSVSKSYALGGARIGYTHGPHEVMQAIRGVQTFYSYCAARPMQWAATAALNGGDTWQRDMRERYRRAAHAAAAALSVPMPAGGTFLFVDAQPFMRKEDSLSTLLGRCLDAGVMLTPGTACGATFDTWLRLCFTSVPESTLHEALQRLHEVLFEKP